MNHPEATYQNKAKQIWGTKINREQNYRVDEHSATNCLLQLHTQVF
jgi:hypothetical protein